MKIPFVIGDTRKFVKVVTEADIAAFESGVVHEVYATFSMARDAEWSGRLFVLDMLEEGEEGIGTQLSITHDSPAFLGDEVVFTATLEAINGHKVITSFKATVQERVIGHGQQAQKIVRRDKLQRLFDQWRPPA